MRQQGSIAKIARPVLPDVYPRERLFKQLDRARRSPLIWVSSPAGSGKTTLINSYLAARTLSCLWYQADEGDADLATFFYYLGLAGKTSAPDSKQPFPLFTPEYLGGVTTFARRFFETLCSRLQSPHVIVLDNYQEVPETSLFSAVVREGVVSLPPGVNLIVISRSDPPDGFMQFRANRTMEVVDWEDLKFTLADSRGMLKLHNAAPLSPAAIRRVHEAAHGWAAGIILLSEERKTAVEGAASGRWVAQDVFDYFAGVIFRKLDATTRKLLLTTSFLEPISPAAAERMSGMRDAGTVLADLSRRNCFTVKRSGPETTYQYHPLFRAFLERTAAETFSNRELQGLKQRAADLLVKSGMTESAMDLFCEAYDWQAAAALIRMHARTMLQQGRHRTLAAWLGKIPRRVVEQDPWLLSWLGESSMPFDVPASRQCCERALELFRKRRDAEGVFLAWAGAVEALVEEMSDLSRLEPWIALGNRLVSEYAFPSPEIEALVTMRMFIAMRWRRTDPKFVAWCGKALALLESGADPAARLLAGYYLYSFHSFYVGDQATSGRILDAMRRITSTRKTLSPMAIILAKCCEASSAWRSGRQGDCLDVMTEGLEIAEHTGCRHFDAILLLHGAASCLHTGELAQAERLLGTMTEAIERGGRPFDRIYHHHCSAQLLLLRNDVSRARVHEEDALALAEKTGWEIGSAHAHFALAHISRAQGDGRQARRHLVRSRSIGRRIGSTLIEFMCLLSDAALTFDEGDERTGTRLLHEALILGREQGYIYFTWWQPSLMRPLCRKAIDAGIEPEYVAGLMHAYGFAPEQPPYHIESWPWPVRLFTLGGFRLLVDDKPVTFSGKVQKKPLELLKALIAFGGKNVREEQLMDALWPDSEGDAGRMAFKTTLHRLRQLLGREEMVQYQDGRVSLNGRQCWIDAWAFERMLELAERSPARAGAQTTHRSTTTDRIGLLEKALQCYDGHFLAEDDEKPWVVSLRERLKDGFVRAVRLLGDTLLEYLPERGKTVEQAHGVEQASACYRRGLEVDDLAEEFYQGLMKCSLRLGKKAEAVKVYYRCKRVLAAGLGVEPSEEIEMLYRDITKK